MIRRIGRGFSFLFFFLFQLREKTIRNYLFPIHSAAVFHFNSPIDLQFVLNENTNSLFVSSSSGSAKQKRNRKVPFGCGVRRGGAERRTPRRTRSGLTDFGRSAIHRRRSQTERPAAQLSGNKAKMKIIVAHD